jgi:hypothetical protein
MPARASSVAPTWRELPRRAFAATATIALSCVALGGADPTADGSRPELVLTASHGYGNYGFAIGGTSPSGLYPGAVRPIRLTFTNPQSVPLRINAVHGRLTATSKAGCAPIPANLTIGDFGGRLPITMRPHSRSSAGSISVHMPQSVADACQGAVFRILLTGDAIRVGR